MWSSLFGSSLFLFLPLLSFSLWLKNSFCSLCTVRYLRPVLSCLLSLVVLSFSQWKCLSTLYSGPGPVLYSKPRTSQRLLIKQFVFKLYSPVFVSRPVSCHLWSLEHVALSCLSSQWKCLSTLYSGPCSVLQGGSDKSGTTSELRRCIKNRFFILIILLMCREGFIFLPCNN